MSPRIECHETCDECGSADIQWTCKQATLSGIADGRLQMRDVFTSFVLGCNECSETVRVMTGDEVARWMNATKADVRPGK